jgi:hypothetical protein
MTAQEQRRAAASRIGLVVLLAVFELGLALISGVAWRALALGQVTGAEVTSLLLVGASAVVGVPVAVLIGYQNLLAAGRPGPARRRARGGQRWDCPPSGSPATWPRPSSCPS